MVNPSALSNFMVGLSEQTIMPIKQFSIVMRTNRTFSSSSVSGHYNGGCKEHFMFLFFLTKIHYTIRNKCFQSNGFESNKLAINFDNIFSP